MSWATREDESNRGVVLVVVEPPVNYPTIRTPELSKQGLDIRCMSMTAHMSSCGSKGQVRDAHLHSQADPDGGRYGSIFINEQLLAADLPLRRDLGILLPENLTPPAKVGRREGGHEVLTCQTSSDT